MVPSMENTSQKLNVDSAGQGEQKDTPAPVRRVPRYPIREVTDEKIATYVNRQSGKPTREDL